MIKMRRVRTSFAFLFVLGTMVSSITASQGGILSALRERMRPNNQATNRNLPGPAPFAPQNSPFFMVESDPSAVLGGGGGGGGAGGGPHHRQQPMGHHLLGGPLGAGPSPLHRSGSFGPGAYSAMSEEGGPNYNYEDGPMENSESGRVAGGPGGAGGGGVLSSQQLNAEFAEADGVTPQEAGANDEEDDFDFDNDSAQAPASSSRRQQKKSAEPANRRKGGYGDGYRYAPEPASPRRRPGKNNKNSKNSKKQPQYAQERQNNPDEREPNDFFPYREFGEQPDRDTPAEYEEYGDYTEGLGGAVADGPDGGRPGGDPDLDIADRPGGGGQGIRDPAFDFDDYDERERDPVDGGLRDPDLDGPVDGIRGPGGDRPGGFPGFNDGERDEGGEGGETSDDRVLSDGDDLPLGGPGGPGGPNGGRGPFFGGLRNRGSGGRPGGAPSNRFSIFGRGR